MKKIIDTLYRFTHVLELIMGLFVLAAILGKYFADTCLLQRYIPGSYIFGLLLPPYGIYKFETGRNFPI